MKRTVQISAALLCVALLCFSLGEARAANQTYTNAPAGTPWHALIQGFRLIKAGDFQGWVNNWCHKGDLCRNSSSIRSLKKYNLPAMKRLLNYNPSCLSGNGDSIVVSRVDGDPLKDNQIRVFCECRPNSMPRPIKLKKENGHWRFNSI